MIAKKRGFSGDNTFFVELLRRHLKDVRRFKADGSEMTLSIRNLINRISSGDIRIPAFQRDYVWEPEQAAFLLDSIYKGFPIGTVVLWKTDTRLNSEKRLGSFDLPEPAKDYPVNYVLDGQQRLTSLFSSFQNDLAPANDEWVDLYFDMLSAGNLQDSSFAALSADEVDLGRYFPVKTLFQPVEYQKACAAVNTALLDSVHSMAAKFYEFLIPNSIFESDDRNAVAIVFERINRAGTELDIFELLSAWSWSEDFDLTDRFKLLQDEITSHNYQDLTTDKDLQLRVCAGVITGETTPDKIMGLQGEEIRKRFPEIQNGILGAIDFLRKELRISHFRLLPFPGILVPLSCFFATDKADGVKYTDAQRTALVKWFWRSVFSRRFSAGVNERQAEDIAELRHLLADENHDVKLPAEDNKVDFLRGNFSAGTANSKTLIIMLNQMNPRSLLSGALVNTEEVLKKGGKHEYHHIFPQAYLKKLGVPRADINCLANICFLTRSDNNTIKDKAPSDYIADIPNGKREEYLSLALCPANTSELNFEAFRVERVKKLNEVAKALMS